MADDQRSYMEFDESDHKAHVKLLSMRIDHLVREKDLLDRQLREEKDERERQLREEKVERAQSLREETDERRKLDARVAKIEVSFQRGAGALIIIPIIGSVIGLIAAYGKIIFAPWISK